MRAMADRVNAALRRIPVWPFYILGFVPAAAWLWLGVTNRLGADPLQRLEHELGLTALQLLIAALFVTPLREQTGISLLRFRRMLGLMAFSYVVMHFTVWLVLDRQLDWPRILQDLTKRPYIILGFAAFVMLIPLALTSWNGAVRRLGGDSWRKLHRLAYVATALGAIHFVWLVKAWPPEPLIYAGITGLLLAYRVLPTRIRRPRRPALS